MNHPAIPDDDLLEDAEDIDATTPALDFGAESAGDLAPLAFILGIEHRGTRLDKVLSQCLPQFSRSRLQQWIEQGRVSVDGEASGGTPDHAG